MKVVSEEIEIRSYKAPLKLSTMRRRRGIERLFDYIKNKMILRNKMKKVVITAFVGLFLLLQNPVAIALAIESPSTPSAPATPEAPSTPSTPSAPATPEAPSTPSTPSAPATPSLPESIASQENTSDNKNKDQDENGEKKTRRSRDNTSSNSQQTTNSNDSQGDSVNQTPSLDKNETGGQDNGGNVGNTSINTGNADNTGTIVTQGNTNSGVSGGPSSGGTTISNTGNGSGSNNSGSATVSNTDNTTQINSANVGNSLILGTVTGDNSSSKNVGNTAITTGDANTTGTVITAVNTNIDGIMVNEFNIVDDHVGDVVLDFSTGCISGCGGATSIVNSGNGTESTNTGEVNVTNQENTFQANEATITNDLVLYSITGDNEADKNTGGSSTITTGDANVSANVLNFANNNLAGDVVYAVVNIFGNLVGDILLPDGSVLSCCANDVNVQNKDNGSDSINTGEVTLSNTDTVFQYNDATIQNNLIIDANTGDNEVSDNTGGTNSITTGDVDVLAQVVNVANMNLIGGNWWLVIVNEAGNWIGKIIGAPDGSNVAGSEGFGFVVDENGEINVVNSGNGSDTQNTGSVTQQNTSNITQINDANIVNNVNLTANTGDNSASKNTGGDSTIKTGDANVVANIVNFVNNNIVGSGKLFVTVVNVFGSWLGDFVGPGQSKEAEHETQQALGGATQNSSNSGGGNSGTNANSSTSSSSSSPAVQGVVAAVSRKFATRGGGTIEIAVVNEDQEEKIADATLALGSKVDKKTVRINLAWLVVIVPLAGAYFFLRKLRASVSSLPTKGA